MTAPAQAVVVALMIGELDYMPLDRAQGRRALNRISTAIVAGAVPLDLPFDAADPDWKLKSAALFRAYNAAAHLYGLCRGWL